MFKSHEHIDETKQLTNELFLNFLKKYIQDYLDYSLKASIVACYY